MQKVLEDRKDVNDEAAVDVWDVEKILKDGFIVTDTTRHEWDKKVRSRDQRDSDIDQRWEDWVFSSHVSWMQKNEEEQRRDLDMRWKYLKALLNRQGIDTSNHRLLLSMKNIYPDDPNEESEPEESDEEEEEPEEGTVEITIGSPDRGLVSINRSSCLFTLFITKTNYHHAYLHYLLPRQTVSGLLCFTSRNCDAFVIYNPITGERSPWKACISNVSSASSSQVVQGFTVGKNTWRRIDAAPPIALECGHHYFYVDGCLYWRIREPAGEQGELELIMRFDIVTEKFRAIPVPAQVVDPKRTKWSQTVELTEIDGRIALLNWIWELEISLWTIQEQADGNIKWTEEVIKMPPHWNGKPELSIEALTGTDLIFLRNEWSDSVFYYNRNTKESIRFPISPDCVPSFCWERIIQV
ncbi:hypothetical protein MKX03_014658 [Papaver bracteatum]|nr:hypothetical protein MKX03_014658 [Papaver bracteatum]